VRPVRVLLVDDQPLLLSGFALILSTEEDIEVVGQVTDGRQAIAAVRQHRPDVVLMDVQMPVLDGIEATRVVVAESDARVVILTTFDRDDYLFDALRAGASGFLLKNADTEDLLDAIRAVAGGHALLAPEVTRRVISRMTGRVDADGDPRLAEPAVTPGPPQATEALTQLTDRERDVLVRLARGLSNAEIAADLWVSEATVKTHVSNVLAKLGVRDRVQAVIVAFEAGLVRPGA
jgi:DNA-binding NarL/FixJ family response regulator